MSINEKVPFSEVASFFGALAADLEDDMPAQPSRPAPMTPSEAALAIDEAHKIYKRNIGTEREALARKYLEVVVANVKARSANL